MLEDETLKGTLDQLTGVVEEKPFECVGSRDEVNTAVCMTIARMEQEGRKASRIARALSFPAGLRAVLQPVQ